MKVLLVATTGAFPILVAPLGALYVAAARAAGHEVTFLDWDSHWHRSGRCARR